MTYEQTLEFLFKQLPMYQKQGKTAFKKDLGNIRALCSLLKHPEKQFKSVHIAGTNGKGSTAHMMASVFQEAGYKTGLYTSPHLKDFRERIRINGQMIDPKEVVQFVENFQLNFDQIQPSFFEWTVALAFHYFALQKVDIAIIETGLGGRLDSTNVITPELSLITNIGLDHVGFLGDTLEKIAKEKAGIIKNNIPAVVVNDSGQKEVFEEYAKQKSATLCFTQNFSTSIALKTDLNGHYQKENAKGVIHAVSILKQNGWDISDEQLIAGLQKVVKNTALRGRWEILAQHPTIVAETAHNKEGLRLALDQLNSINSNRVHFVLGFVKDKMLESVLSLFPKNADYYFCQADIPRALDVNLLKKSAYEFGLKGKTYSSVNKALAAAKANALPSDLIYVGGSNFVVAEVL